MKGLVTFIDYMAEEYKRKQRAIEHLENEGKHAAAQDMKNESFVVWNCLYAFCTIILTGSKFQSQKYYCRKILQELHPAYWDALETARLKSRAIRAQQTRRQNAKGNTQRPR